MQNSIHTSEQTAAALSTAPQQRTRDKSNNIVCVCEWGSSRSLLAAPLTQAAAAAARSPTAAGHKRAPLPLRRRRPKAAAAAAAAVRSLVCANIKCDHKQQGRWKGVPVALLSLSHLFVRSFVLCLIALCFAR